LETVSQTVCCVTQETFLFNATVRENLRYAKLDATEDELTSATRLTAIHDRIVTLSEGYDTRVGERGFCFSGGERQRLALARAILRDPPILVLDEATSAIDPELESRINANLTSFFRGRTTLIIAHRLSAVSFADAIFVMEQGQIAAQGSHRELLANSLTYRRLFRQQSFDAVPV
jgi:ATP-binding cassette subfamily B protein